MKNLIAKIKSFDYKGFLLRHGEKVGMGATVLFVLLCLTITNWSSTFSKSPQQLQEDAETMEKTLRTNVWPEAEKAKFTLLPADRAVAALTAPVNLAEFRYSVLMSPPLYTYRQPADEPEIVAVADLRVSPGFMAMEVQPPPLPDADLLTDPDADQPVRGPMVALRGGSRSRNADPDADQPVRGARADLSAGAARIRQRDLEADADRPVGGARMKPRGADRGDRRSDKKSGVLPTASFPIGGDGTRPGAALPPGAVDSTSYATTKVRGVRYNAVVGVVDVKRQLNILQNALHLESAADVLEHLEYLDFKIQRQRAVRGPDPWKDENGQDRPWVDLDTSKTIEVIDEEAVDLDPDVVPPQHLDSAITCPLPHRLDGEWDFSDVGHPKVPSLDEEARKIEDLANRLAAELAPEEDGEEAQYTRGFRKVQKDVNRLRQRAMNVASDPTAVNAAIGRAMPNRRGQPLNPDDDDRRSPFSSFGRGNIALQRLGVNPKGAIPAQRPDARLAYPNAPLPNSSGMADLLLFRYLDFAVEPGECYRYRVQVIIRNPSFDQEYVSSPDVAAGFDRQSKWSEPSRPAVVPKDMEYALVRTVKRSGHREGAELSVVQLDTEEGTLISGTLKKRYGEYLAGEVKSPHLKLTVPSLEDENVKFDSAVVLVDSASAVPISGSALQDLKLSQQEAQKLIKGGVMDRAVTLNRFGELIPLDADSQADFKSARKQYEEQNKEYDYLAEEKAAAAKAAAALRASSGYDGEEGMKVNPLKRNSRGNEPGSFRPPRRKKRGGGRRGE
jgi:hypothetical protein